MPSFNDFRLQPTTRAVLADMKITEPTPIQAEAIPVLLDGNDLVGQSPTGSGKTLAYSIPLVERLSKDKRVAQALVLVPTRELAVQINTVMSKLAASRRLTTALLVGGRPYGNQISALKYGAQIIIGTPGRIQDHLERGTLVLTQLRICILDEADQMLDSGFAPVIEEILTTTPDTRQMALFSATIPEWVATLQKKFLKNPTIVDITRDTDPQSTIEQVAYQVPQDQKMAALCTLLRSTEGESSLIFGRTKFGVEKLGKQLSKLGFTVGTLHGNKSQRAREEVLTAFRRGQIHTLLATNVAARGLDIKGIHQVINYELPESSDLFTHRIGRTGRMGEQGKAITLLAPADVAKWRRMARNLGQAVTLQRLTVDAEAAITPQFAMTETPVTQEYKQRDEQRLERDSRPAPSTRRRPKESVSDRTPVRTPARQQESFTAPERPYSDRGRDSRRDAGRPSRFSRTPSRQKTYSSATTEPQQRTARRRSSTPDAGRTQRQPTSYRAASR